MWILPAKLPSLIDSVLAAKWQAFPRKYSGLVRRTPTLCQRISLDQERYWGVLFLGKDPANHLYP